MSAHFFGVAPLRFAPVGPEQSGLWAGGDVRSVTLIYSGQQKWLVAGRNNEEALVFRIHSPKK